MTLGLTHRLFNVITGLPRSGSTLLCNILNQNPRFNCSSIDFISGVVSGISTAATNSEEFKSELIRDKDDTHRRLRQSIRGAVEGWCEPEGTYFNKSRGWSHIAPLLREVYPGSVIIATVRDPRDVFASIESAHRKTALLGGGSIYERADEMFSPDGIIGSAISGVEDLLRRDFKGVLILQYEFFVKSPQIAIDRIYTALSEDPYAHDFDNVENTATDVDGLYLNKFPHEGSGKVNGDSIGKWKDLIDPDLAATIMSRYPFYCKTLGYQ